MKKFFLLTIVCLSVIALTGCGKKNALIGKWKGETTFGISATFEFKKDGKLVYTDDNNVSSTGTYKIKDNVVTIDIKTWSSVVKYDFDILDKVLTLKSHDSEYPDFVSMIKQK